jgi:hypothetical protein
MFTSPRRLSCPMRKLNELLRSLSRFLHDPGSHVGDAWKLVRGYLPAMAALDPETRNAVVVIDNVVGAVAYFLTDKAGETEADAERPAVAEPVAAVTPAS